jgi:hypothetical protein
VTRLTSVADLWINSFFTLWSGRSQSVNSAGRAVMKVEGTPVVSDAGRQSIRISTSWRFNAGSILIMDATHMPVGCGTWPAWWTLGTSTYWPLYVRCRTC